jgi:hypothetical protein
VFEVFSSRCNTRAFLLVKLKPEILRAQLRQVERTQRTTRKIYARRKSKASSVCLHFFGRPTSPAHVPRLPAPADQPNASVPTQKPAPPFPIQASFTSSVFMGIKRDYFVSQKIPTNPFTSPVLNDIIPRYPLSYPSISTFFA